MKVAIVNGFVDIDDEDFELISKYNWYAKKSGNNYHAYHTYYLNGKPKHLIMHRLIMGLIDHDKKVVDHIDHNTLNNMKLNLRVCDNARNARNSLLSKSNTSGFKGVSKSKGKWQAYIRVNRRRINLGTYSQKIDAAKAYNDAAKKYFGEFAKINKV